MIKRILLMAVFSLLALPALAQQTKNGEWDSWRFVLGDWTASEGGGKPGEASSGGLSFSFDLQGKVLIRRSYSEYPATKDRPAFRHDDLTVIYHDANGKDARAISFDNEGHVIQYSASFSEDNRKLTFSSDASAGPRFRLVFSRLSDDSMKVEFFIAPPEKPEAFSKYVEGMLKRK